jgi:signal transduction histidine kinase
VRLSEVAESVLQLLEGRCRHENVNVLRDFADVPSVLADGNQIRQVVMNLVINAIEAMPGGGDVRLSLAPGGGGRVRFSVADRGRGVSAAEGEDVFSPFVTTKPGSVGLGLHVCRQIIRDHGGRIGYDNPGAGAVFWFELPVCDGAEAPNTPSGRNPTP